VKRILRVFPWNRPLRDQKFRQLLRCGRCPQEWNAFERLFPFPDRRRFAAAGFLQNQRGNVQRVLLAFASGQAAITAAVLTITHAGQNFISATSLYGGTWTLFTQTFPKLGVEVRFFDHSKPETLSKLVDKNTRALYLETPGNPKNDIPDYRKITGLAHKHGLPTIVDNTVLTPALFQPIEHGFDIVVYSTTKFIGGHGVHIGGAIVDSGKFPWAKDPKKWPEFTAPDPAYHGVVFEEALRPIGNIAYIIYVRTHWLRDVGGCPRRRMRSLPRPRSATAFGSSSSSPTARKSRAWSLSTGRTFLRRAWNCAGAVATSEKCCRCTASSPRWMPGLPASGAARQ